MNLILRKYQRLGVMLFSLLDDFHQNCEFARSLEHSLLVILIEDGAW